MHHAHRVLHRGALEACGLLVLLGAAQARQDQGAAAVDQVAAVELGAHLHREIAGAQPRTGVRGVRSGEGEVAAHRDEDLDVPAVHGLDGGDGVHAVCARCLDAADLVQPRQECLGGAVVDAAGAVALDVAVPAHGRGTGPFAAEVPAQQQEVGDFADGVDAMLVLGDAQAPADDAAVGVPVHPGGLEDLVAGQPGLHFKLFPRGGLAQRAVLLEPGGVPLEELPVQGLGVGGGEFQDGLGHAAQQGHVAADARLEVQRAGLRGTEDRHVQEVVRDDGAGGGGLHHRVDVHHLRPAAVGLGQGREHPGCVGGGVDAHDEQRVRRLPVLEVDGALARAQGCLERTAAGLVAHVGAVRQVVGAQLAGHQLVEERGLVAQPAGGVVGRLVGIPQAAERSPDKFERIGPADGHVVVARGVVHHRFGQAPLAFEFAVAPPGQFGDRMGGEELRPHALVGHFPGDVLDAVLADVQVQALGVVGPGAPGAVEPLALVVHPEDGFRAVHQLALAGQDAPDAHRRAPAGRGVVVWPETWRVLGVGTRPRIPVVLFLVVIEGVQGIHASMFGRAGNTRLDRSLCPSPPRGYPWGKGVGQPVR